MTSPTKPTCSRSMPPSKPPVREKWGKVSLWWRSKCAKLAERSQQAAKEISALAKSSVNRCGTSGESHSAIGSVDTKTHPFWFRKIASACAEQSSGANQIKDVMIQLEQITQENSSTSEESASASEELSAQAQSLQELVNTFRIDTSMHYNQILDFTKSKCLPHPMKGNKNSHPVQTEVKSRKPSNRKRFTCQWTTNPRNRNSRIF